MEPQMKKWKFHSAQTSLNLMGQYSQVEICNERFRHRKHNLFDLLIIVWIANKMHKTCGGINEYYRNELY